MGVKDVEWSFKAFGTNSSDDKKLCGSLGDARDGEVRVYSLMNCGKIIPLSMDGLSFYYTSIPSDKNFSLKAKMHINSWSFTNGQEGFGLMVCDRIGEVGEHDFWNNSIMACVTKCNYGWDKEKNEYSREEGSADINMFQGVCALARYGVTPDNLQLFKDNPSQAVEKYYVRDHFPLEHTCGHLGDGSYNIAGNYVKPHDFDENKLAKDYEKGTLLSGAEDATPGELVCTDFVLSIKKHNSGYTVCYETEDGILIGSRTYYDGRYYDNGQVREDLSQALAIPGILESFDKDFVHAGFYAARNADVSFSDIELEITEPQSDEPTLEHEKNYFDNISGFACASVSNTRKSTLTYMPSWRGELCITSIEKGFGDNGDEPEDDGLELFREVVEPGKYVHVPVSLITGENNFKAVFAPDVSYHLGYDEDHPENIYNTLRSYDPVEQSICVTYKQYGEEGGVIYVSPAGSSSGDGSKTAPLDIFTAISFARPGQSIYLAGGVYELSRPVRIERGIDGTKSELIKLMTDPEAEEIAVFDFRKDAGFGKLRGSFNLLASYWQLENIEITNAPDRLVGLWIAGNCNVVKKVRSHHNGNVGICILSASELDKRDDVDAKGRPVWPTDNQIIDCESYENSDLGGDLADGFACKVRAGEGNVFDGCVSHNNADDGFDLYTKSETGRIGVVTIRNCISYMNGYITRDGQLKSMGNGNGFKLGGESIPGGHVVRNCQAYKNKGKGFDTNRCPDPKISDCISVDNEKANIALYTAKGKITDFKLERFRSIRTSEGPGDIIECGVNQSLEDVLGENVYTYKLNEG